MESNNLQLSQVPVGSLWMEIRQTLALAWPVVVGQLAIVGMNLVDTVLAGRISAQVLAEVAIGTAVWGVCVLWIIGVMMALSPEISSLRGSGKTDALADTVAQGLYMALGISLFAFLLVPLAPWLLDFMRVEPKLIPGALRFLHGVMWGAPFLAWYVGLQKFCEGMGHTRATLYFSSLALCLLMPIGYVLINGRLGFPRLEALGVGLATAIVNVLIALGISLYVFRRFVGFGILRRWPRPDWRRIRNLLGFGAPIAVAILMEAGLFYVVLLLMSRFGKDWVAAHSVALNVASLAFMIPLGLANAVTVRVGYFAGSHQLKSARRTAFAGWSICLFTQAFSASVMIFLSRWIATSYLPSEPNVVPMAVGLLAVAALFQFPDGIQVISAGALRGLKDSRWPMVLTSVAYWGFGFPLAHHLAFETNTGPKGLWYGFIAGLSVAAVLLSARFLWMTRSGLAAKSAGAR